MVDHDDCILFNLAKAYQAVHGRFAALLKPHGLTPIQALVLQTVSEEQGQSASEISKRLVLDNATISGVLDRLGDGGWIERKNDETDRRINRIFLSAKAAQQGRTLSELRTETNDQVMASLSTEERVLLMRLLRDVR